MSVAVGPFTIVPAQHLEIVVPPPGTHFTHVVIYNQSSLYLQLNGQALWLPPWTADIFDLATVGYPVRTVVAGTLGVSGIVLATFFSAGELPPNAVYPLALPSTSPVQSPLGTLAVDLEAVLTSASTGSGSADSGDVAVGTDILVSANMAGLYTQNGATTAHAIVAARLIGVDVNGSVQVSIVIGRLILIPGGALPFTYTFGPGIVVRQLIDSAGPSSPVTKFHMNVNLETHLNNVAATVDVSLIAMFNQ